MTSRRKFQPSALIGLFAGLLMLPALPALSDTLKDAIDQAYEHNPTLERQRAQQRANDETYVQARSGLGPSVSAGLNSSYAHYPRALGGVSSTATAALSLTQTLFASGGMRASVDAANADVKAGQQSLRSGEGSILLDVISVYSAVREDLSALKISQDNVEILKTQLAQVQAQFEAGQLTRTDVAQSQARLSAASASVADAQAQLDADRASYIAIVGQAPTALEAEPDLPGLPAEFDAALNVALTNNPDLQAALYAEDAAAARVRAAKSAYGPRVSLSANAGQYAPDASRLGVSTSETSATLQLSIPLFTSGLNASQVRKTVEDENAQKAASEITRRQVTQTVAKAWSQMLASRSAVASNKEQVTAAQIAADGVKTEQQVGLRTNIEVLNAEQELKAAQLALVSAQRSQYVAASQVLYVMGNLTVQTFDSDAKSYDPAANFDRLKHKGWTPIEPVIEAIDNLGARTH